MDSKELTLKSEILSYYPLFFEGFRKAKKIIDSIRNFDDIELYLLKGRGLSPRTYANYLVAVKQLYAHTKGLNPFQIMPQHIEDFYDDLLDHVELSSACAKMAGLKCFFNGIKSLAPGWVSPFDIMPEKLIKKLNRPGKSKGCKKALNIQEVKRILRHLKKDRTIQGKSDYALFLILVTSGLRVGELCQLRWKDIEEFPEGIFTARFIGKGGLDAEQELYPPAVKVIPRRGEYLFYNELQSKHPADEHYCWRRFNIMYRELRDAGILKRELRFSPHLCRRTYATSLYKSGMRLKALMEKTRHSNMDTLTKHYVDDSEPASPYFEKILAMA